MCFSCRAVDRDKKSVNGDAACFALVRGVDKESVVYVAADRQQLLAVSGNQRKKVLLAQLF